MSTTVLITCDNKGCYNQNYHKLDVESDKVFCLECKQEINAVSPYMKKVLKSNNQTFKRARSSNEMTCKNCGFTGDPILLDYGKDVYEVACSKCKVADAHLTNYFVEPLKMNPDVKKVKVKYAEADEQVELEDGEGLVNDSDELLFDEEGPDESLEQSAPPVKVVSQHSAVGKGSWLSPKKEDRGPPPPGSVDAELIAQQIAAQSQQAHLIHQNQPVQGILSPKQRARPAKPYKVPSPQEMLKRAGVKYTGDIDEDEYEDRQEVRQVIRKSPANRPKTAAEMLQRAGFELASTDDGLADVDLGDEGSDLFDTE